MKKILYVLAAVALFAIAGCSTGMHDGTQMKWVGVKITDLPEAWNGQTLNIRGPFNGWDSNDPNVGTIVNGVCEITFSTPVIISDPNIIFKFAAPGGWGTREFPAGMGGEYSLPNLWTGPVIGKTAVVKYSTSGASGTWE